MSCVQSNAAAVAAVRTEERYLFQFRKGYCELFGAVVTGTSDGFRAAAADFTDAVFSWPLKTVPGPPSALPALISIAHLEQGRMVDSYPDLAREMESILAVSGCPATPIMSPAFCSDLLATAKVWLGWLAYRKNDFAAAAQGFKASPTSGWNRGSRAGSRRRRSGCPKPRSSTKKRSTVGRPVRRIPIRMWSPCWARNPIR